MDKSKDLELSSEPKRKELENENRISKEFISTCTLHGLHYIFDKRRTYQRILWLLFMLLMLGLFLWQASTLFTSYLQYKVISRMEIAYNRRVEFPVITICNENMYRKSAINGTDFGKLLDARNPLYFNQSAVFNWTTYNVSHINMTELLHSAAHKLPFEEKTKTGMLYKCTWEGNTCTADNFTKVMTDMGLCYSFNAGKNPLLASGPGDKYGLKLIMSVEQKEYNGRLSFSSGLRILVHNQSEPPLTRDFGFAVMPRSHVYAAISKHRVVSLPAPYETTCLDKKLYGMETYTKSACFTDCMERFVISNCSCRAFYMKDERHPICNITSYFKCVLNAKELFDRQGRDDCDCTESCDTTSYTTYLSYGQFPSYAGVKEYANDSEEDKWTYEHDLIAIDLYFQKLDYNIVHQVPIYDAGSLFGELGGLLGLFLGASLITINEIVDFLLQYACSRLNRR